MMEGDPTAWRSAVPPLIDRESGRADASFQKSPDLGDAQRRPLERLVGRTIPARSFRFATRYSLR